MAIRGSTTNFQAGSISLALLTCVLIGISLVEATTINVKNQCSQTLTTCATSSSGPTNSYVLGSGSSQLLDVDGSWPGGAVWGFFGSGGDCHAAKPQSTLAEFNINSKGQDYYDISLVNAFNMGLQIDAVGSNCTLVQCSIFSIVTVDGFCQPPNSQTGPPGQGCYNHDGPYVNHPTRGTQVFKDGCPNAITYTTDTSGTIFSCSSGTNYEVVFCF